MPEQTPADSGFDMAAAVDEVSSGLGLDLPNTPEPVEDVLDDKPDEAHVDADPNKAAKAANQKAPEGQEQQKLREPPKAWAKEKHPIWSTLQPEAQEYIELREKQILDGLEQYKGEATYGKSLRDAITPYKAMLQAQGVDEVQAVQYLLNANYRLTNGTAEERMAVYRQLGADLGLEQPAADGQQQVDPAIKQLQNEIKQLKSGVQQQQTAAQQATRQKVDAEIQQFAADPANAHFDEVANDMAIFVQQGMTLKDAYDRAVWANPITRQKEQERVLTERETALREKAKAEAEAARRTASTNVRDVQTRKAPTEPKGSMEDTMRATLREIRERVN